MARLIVSNLKVRYGKTEVLRGVDFEVDDGEIVCLLGANGSGKSTVLNAVSGFVRPWHGSIVVDGEEIACSDTHQVFRHGVALVSQTRDLFPEMTVDENLELGLACVNHAVDKGSEMSRVYNWLPVLGKKRKHKAQTLSGGEQQMIAIGRALISRPKVLLLDEPSGGLAPRVVEEVAGILTRLKHAGFTMMVVEQNLFLATAVADRFYIMRGGIVEDGDEIVRGATTKEEIVRSIYL